MTDTISISAQDILRQIKLSYQLPSVIESIATRQIITKAAAEAGIRVEAEELQQAADSIRLVNNLHSASDTWQWLDKYGLSLEEFEAIAQYNVLSAKLATHLFAERVDPFFVNNQLDYAGAVIYEVVLEDEDLAMELFYTLSEGEISFHEVARQYIQDVSLRRAGGYRGILSRRQLEPQISAAVFAATPPQILEPIVTSNGVHLILVEEILQPQLDERLRQKILADLFTGWMQQKLKKANIVSNLDTGEEASQTERSKPNLNFGA
ncbi:MAG: peptidylprolyl isomerase [Cyanophyceae cyanobacterium]